jgi:hypothetical protein
VPRSCILAIRRSGHVHRSSGGFNDDAGRSRTYNRAAESPIRPFVGVTVAVSKLEERRPLGYRSVIGLAAPNWLGTPRSVEYLSPATDQPAIIDHPSFSFNIMSSKFVALAILAPLLAQAAVVSLYSV